MIFALQQARDATAETAVNWPSIVVSGCALAFTVLSFYWLNFRRGKLVAARPRTFACAAGAERELVIVLPLVFYNDGAAHIVVENLRLVLLESPLLPLTFMATWDRLTTSMKIDAKRDFANPFPIAGRQSRSVICDFQRTQPLAVEVKGYPCRLEARMSGAHEWITVSEFSLDFDEQKAATANTHVFTVFDE